MESHHQGGGSDPPKRGVSGATVVPVLVVLLAALGLSACGLGTYSDTGGPLPGQWWPWVCPDGGTPDPDAGCVPVPRCSDSNPSACADGGVR